MKEPVYEVFARKNREDALRHIGYVNAVDPDLARVYAWKTYDEQNWFEMCIVAREALLPVNRLEGHAYPAPATSQPVVRSRGVGAYGGDEVVMEEADA